MVHGKTLYVAIYMIVNVFLHVPCTTPKIVNYQILLNDFKQFVRSNTVNTQTFEKHN